MSFEKFLQASNKLTQGIQQYVQTESLSQANNKLAEIQDMQNAGLIKQEEAIQQASQLSQLLSNQLAGAGADAATIANTAGRFWSIS